MRHPVSIRRARPLSVLVLSLWPLLALPCEAASISGVCPDGSIFIVQDRARIPCERAKEVAPSDVPPVRPEYLPRPYTWQVYREGANPNNPYNLIDAARRVRALRDGAARPPGDGTVGTTVLGGERRFGAGTAAPGVAQPRGAPQAGPGAAPLPGAAGPAGSPAHALALSSDDVRDLFLIVELSQRAAPCRFVKEDASSEPTLEVSCAHSPAFEARFREGLPSRGRRVILFSVLAHRPEAFHPNFTFVQDHETFHPALDDPTQIGFLEGGAGPLAAESVALGYVTLPDRMDLDRSLDLYWNDRRIETVLEP